MSRLHSKLFRPAVAVALLVAVGLFARPASAGPTSIDVQQFRPNPHTLGGFAVDSARVLPHLQWSVGLIANYAQDPLRLVRGADNETVWNFVEKQLTGDFLLSIGLFDFLDIGLDVPVTLLLDGGLPPGPGAGAGTRRDLPGSGLGDIRLTPRAQFLDGLFGLGLAVDLYFPTGNSEAYMGASAFRAAPRVNMHLDFDFLMVLMNVGMRFADDAELFDLRVGHELFWGVGVVFPIAFNDDAKRPHALDIIGEMTSYTELGDPYGSPNESGLEMRAGVRYRVPNGVAFTLAAGPGIMPGYGTPEFRVLAGIQYSPVPAEPCPEVKVCEDPRDPDRDRDRICDPWVAEEGQSEKYAKVCKRSDECPDVPEDYDGFRDLDGCPEPDNDCDRICDPWVQEANIDQMATYKQFDGCGEKDGTCPAHATQDDAPCPSSADRPYCRMRDGTSDILHDVCPDRPETYNQNEDDDGCPDCTTFIPFTGKIEFQHAKWKMDDLTPASKQLLDDIVARLKSPKFSHIKKIRVEGHTSDMWLGKAWWGYEENIDLSNKRATAVMEYLKANGVPVELESRGYGWTRTPKPPAGLEALGRQGDVIKGDAAVDEWRDRSRRTVFRVVEWASQQGCTHPCEACEELRGDVEPADAPPPPRSTKKGKKGKKGARK